MRRSFKRPTTDVQKRDIKGFLRIRDALTLVKEERHLLCDIDRGYMEGLLAWVQESLDRYEARTTK